MASFPFPLLAGLPTHTGCKNVKLNEQKLLEEERIYQDFKRYECYDHLERIEFFNRHSLLPCPKNLKNQNDIYDQIRYTEQFSLKLRDLSYEIFDKNDTENCLECMKFIDRRLRSRRRSISLCIDNSMDILTSILDSWNENTTSSRRRRPCISSECDKFTLVSKIEKKNFIYDLFNEESDEDD